MLRTLNLDGDRQADLSVHGGPGADAWHINADEAALFARP
jgi:MOSC domain-containing protein YiiM